MTTFLKNESNFRRQYLYKRKKNDNLFQYRRKFFYKNFISYDWTLILKNDNNFFISKDNKFNHISKQKEKYPNPHEH